MSFQIAIDGPVAAGKGTVSRLVADRLKLLYVDTGAMYRVVAFKALESDISWDDEPGLFKMIEQTNIRLEQPSEKTADGRLVTVLLDGEDVSWQIRTEKIGKGASAVSRHPLVRKALVKVQQKIAEDQDVVMEGRDITSVVLPNADLKIYLTANPRTRAKRRHMEVIKIKPQVTLEEVESNLRKRDEDDQNRVADPLQIVSDAWVLDSTEYNITQVVEQITDRVEEIKSNNHDRRK
jgi:CMP/dCMP kinase